MREWQGSNMRKLSPINDDKQASRKLRHRVSSQDFTYLAGVCPLTFLLTHLR
jgi:hypothetical protein